MKRIFPWYWPSLNMNGTLSFQLISRSSFALCELSIVVGLQCPIPTPKPVPIPTHIELDCIVQNSVVSLFSLRFWCHSPIRASKWKINSPRQKFTCLDFTWQNTIKRLLFITNYTLSIIIIKSVFGRQKCTLDWYNSNINSSADGYCSKFGIYIGTDTLEFNSFSLVLYISITIRISSSVAFLHIIGICIVIGTGISLGQCKHTITAGRGVDCLYRSVLVFLNFCKILVSARFCGVCAR